MKPIGPNFRRFVSPTSRGEVNVPSARRPIPARDEPLPGTKTLHVPSEPPRGDWTRWRTVDHYPHDALAEKFGITAAVMLAVVVVMLVTGAVIGSDSFDGWMIAVTVLAFLLANGFGIFSQVLSGGRCWLGSVALVMSWLCLFAVILIGTLFS